MFGIGTLKTAVLSRLGGGVATPPLLLTAQVVSTSPAPTKVRMTFDKPLDGTSIPPTSAFLIVRNSIGRNPQTVSIAGSTCDATMDADYGDPGGGTISYTVGSPPLKGTNGLNVATFNNVAISP